MASIASETADTPCAIPNVRASGLENRRNYWRSPVPFRSWVWGSRANAWLASLDEERSLRMPPLLPQNPGDTTACKRVKAKLVRNLDKPA